MTIEEEVFNNLDSLYGSPDRHHHDMNHVDEALDEVDRLVSLYGGVNGFQHSAVLMAVWFHDAIYWSDRPGSEEASAELADAELTRMEHSRPFIEEVKRLILLTRDHQADGDDLAKQLMCDADLWILNAPLPRYLQYVEDVRREYSHVSDEDWATGRGKLLMKFLIKKDGVFRFGNGRELEHRNFNATANVFWEFSELEMNS